MTEYTKLSNDELVSLIKKDDDVAFAQLYDRFKGLLYIHAFKMLKDDDDAKDAVQEMFIKIWESRKSITINTTVEAYIHKSIIYKVIDFMRRKKTFISYLDSLELYLAKGNPAPDENYIGKETLALFTEELAKLPERMREVFDLSRNHGLTHKQIAEKMNISEHTVKKQISKALKIIKIRINLSLFSLIFL